MNTEGTFKLTAKEKRELDRLQLEREGVLELMRCLTDIEITIGGKQREWWDRVKKRLELDPEVVWKANQQHTEVGTYYGGTQ